MANEVEKATFTPGPWDARAHHPVNAKPYISIHGLWGRKVGEVVLAGESISEDIANTRLIAAAPELLEALELYEELAKHPFEGDNVRYLNDLAARAASKRRAAIAKAKGQQIGV